MLSAGSMTRLEECYRLLEVSPGATDEEVRRAHHDLTKVWHPDRFGHDAALRRKAEEKLKAINAAWETIRESRESFRPEPEAEPAPDAWRIRVKGREYAVPGLQVIAMLVERGNVSEDAEVFDPQAGRWSPLGEFAELRTAFRRRRVRQSGKWALTCGLIAVFLLLRRPTPAGVAIAVILLVLAIVFIARMRGALRG
jgi:curved DNA-binding protein CbpA